MKLKNIQKIFFLSESKFMIILLLALFSYTSYPLTLIAKSQQPASSGNQPPQDGSGRGRPSKRGGAGSRGNCPSVEVPLIALIPEKKVGLIVEENATFWVFVPYQANDVFGGEFVLQDEANNDIYRASFTPPEIPGIVSFSLPSTVPLKVNKTYQWYFKLYCNQQRLDSVFVRGWVQRIALTHNLERQLKAATTLRDRIQLYTQNGIWYSALTELAKLRLAEPQNATLDNEWVSLLKTVELENLARKSLVGEVKIKQ